MNLKAIYSSSIIGIVMLSFSAGWISLSYMIGMPVSYLSAIGLIIGFVGIVVTIKTLSTISKIELKIEEEKP